MKRFLVIALAVALIMAFTVGASAKVERYQDGTVTWTVVVNGTYVHEFDLYFNPCDGSVVPINPGRYTGQLPSPSGGWNEQFGVVVSNGTVTLTSVYLPPYSGTYTWGFTAAFDQGEIGAPITHVFNSVTVSSSWDLNEWKNHGEYVAAMGGGPDAAHSCIGKPIKP